MQEKETSTLEFAAKAEYLAEIRRHVERLGAETALSRRQMDDLLTAVDEATANAIRHGSPQNENSRIRVVCHSQANGLSVEVRDEGAGFAIPNTPAMPGPEATGGRGLPLMCALADSVEIASSPEGTAVTLRKYTK